MSVSAWISRKGFKPAFPIYMGVLLLGIVGYFLYSYAAHYTYLSDANFRDIMAAKLWSWSWILISSALVFRNRNSKIAPAIAVLLVSAYFVILYGILFRGTEYGMNGHWGDNGNRLSEICKMMAYGSFFQDWNLKDLPSFYPPLWFAAMALYGKLLSIEPYQTIKFGYLLIFLAYPWALYFSWKKLVDPKAAAAVAICTLFFGYRLIDWIYYEHITLALFLPWWLYYFMDVTGKKGWGKSSAVFYAQGAVYGAALFMTFYYWFFLAFAAAPVSWWLTRREFGRWREVKEELRHSLTLMAGVAVLSAVYWAPLLASMIKFGFLSAQNTWFGLRHANLDSGWSTIEGMFAFAGIFFVGFLWKDKSVGKLGALFIGAAILVLTDRLTNIFDSSIQSRKILEFTHVLALTPFALGAMSIWNRYSGSAHLRRGALVMTLVAAFVFANDHTQIWTSKKYEIAINQRVPEHEIALMASAAKNRSVVLTNRYIEACYLPYYMFIPVNNMSAHTAGRFPGRKQFLEAASKIQEPELLAYAFFHNKYDKIDFAYLPWNPDSAKFYLTLNITHFNRRAVQQSIFFSVDFKSSPEEFELLSGWGLYKVTSPEKSKALDELLHSKHPQVYRHLENVS